MVSLLNTACEIIYEEDLSDDILFIIMPHHGTVTEVQEQVFWWETIEGVIKYRLQIVEGSFREPYYFVADTNVAGDKFIINLAPGSYEWRIQGWNNYSETLYFYSELNISDTAIVHEE